MPRDSLDRVIVGYHEAKHICDKKQQELWLNRFRLDDWLCRVPKAKYFSGYSVAKHRPPLWLHMHMQVQSHKCKAADHPLLMP